MRILVTAGNTQAPIDRVRCLTNVFTGRTGAAIALHARQRGHAVVLLTSHPEAVPHDALAEGKDWGLRRYRTFDELQALMAAGIRDEPPDAVVHSEAVSDYLTAGIYAPADGTRFDAQTATWYAAAGPPRLADRAAGKVKSDEPELWLRLTRAPKLVDRVRGDWGFAGVLVKFKLEVGVSDERLQEIAEASRRHSGADLMVANTLENASLYAYLGPLEGQYHCITRACLAERLVGAIEACAEGKTRG